MQEVGRKIIFPWCLQNLHDIVRTNEGDPPVLKKIIRWYFLLSNFLEMEKTVFVTKKLT